MGRTNEPGGMSSRREPTAEKARMARTPRDLRAAMLAREGTKDGEMVWCGPCLAIKATVLPEGREAMLMGDEGYPHGWRSQVVQLGFWLLI